MRFTVITPCFNAARYVEETIQSVLAQTAVASSRVELEYWVIDGGSSDGTQEIALRYADRGVRLVSEPDQGMYDALAKGFERTTGDVCCYINAGDYYHRAAFDVVADVLQQSDVHWLTGMYIIYNERSQVVLAQQPKSRPRGWIRQGFYGTVLPHIQQESTFWRTALLQDIDLAALRSNRLAGDFYLWHSFARRHELHIVSSYLGGFKLHAGQLSEQRGRYAKEVAQICGQMPGRLAWVLAVGSKVFEKLMPRKLLITIGYDRAIYWDNDRQRWGA